MNRLLIVTLGAALVAAACGTTASKSDSPLDPETGGPATHVAAATLTKAADPVYRDVTIPPGTALPLTLLTAVASDTSNVEDPINAELRNAVIVDGQEALPKGSTVTGVVARADGAGRVKGRAMVALRFTSVNATGERYQLSTTAISRQAPATKGEDATKIGIGAGAGAALGALLGGKKGAAEGAAVGGGAGTGLVLATKGQEVRLAAGAAITTTLTAPLTVRVRAGSQ